ncbi:MAG: penicillin acylase family protein, partial [Chloroflexota bacterium]
MRWLKRITLGALVLVLVVVVAGAGTLTWLTVRAHAPATGTIQAPGLTAEVVVRRDASGIAHLTASTPADLFFAQGWVHASERMWQMEVWRHISSGRLAELFGPSQLETDRFIRTLGWRRAVERDRDAVSPASRVALDGYAAGVNAWLDANRGSLGIPFLVTGAEPEPWTDLDTLAWGKVQAWNLGGNLDTEIFRMLADARLGDPARTDDLLTLREGGPVITPSIIVIADAAPADARQPATAPDVTEARPGSTGAATRAAAATPVAATAVGDPAAWR